MPEIIIAVGNYALPLAIVIWAFGWAVARIISAFRFPPKDD